MHRELCQPRQEWQQIVEGLGCAFHSTDGFPYWNESACYRFTAAEIDVLEAATAELETMCFAAVRHILENPHLMARMAIPEIAHAAIADSWDRREKNLYGRFDFAFNGKTAPKLLEYNADTPTALLEAAVLQWQWLEDTHPNADQFNSIHEKLVAAWPQMEIAHNTLWFATITDHAEDAATTKYLQDTAHGAGLTTHFLDIREIGEQQKQFVDLENVPITTLFKLYPWEWLWQEPFAAMLHPSGTRFIEPSWKMLLSNKGLLAVLWQLFPQHPLLLPASFSAADIAGDVVRKPLLGREGQNTTISGAVQLQTEGECGSEGYIWQEYTALPDYDGHYPVCGAWVIASQPAGLGIREDSSRITSNMARFVPHYFEE